MFEDNDIVVFRSIVGSSSYVHEAARTVVYPAKAMSIVSISNVIVCRGNCKNSSSRSGLGETNLSVVVVGNGVREQAISWQRLGRWTAQTRRFGSSVEGWSRRASSGKGRVSISS